MDRVTWLRGAPDRYAAAVATRTHGVAAAVSLVVFVGTIRFGFVPVTRKIETSGYATSDLQAASSRAEVDAILAAFEPVMEYVVLLSVLDYLFIAAGLVLFLSLHAIAITVLAGHGRLVVVPKVGMALTAASRLLDALENLWVVLIYTNPDTYPTVLIALMNTTESAKWAFVAAEYTTLGLALAVVLLNRFTPLLSGDRGRR